MNPAEAATRILADRQSLRDAANTLQGVYRNLSLALARGDCNQDWASQVDRLRQVATALQALNPGGQSWPPIRTSPIGAAALPCQWCQRGTTSRIFGHPGHLSCWEIAGRPLLEPAAAPEQPDTEQNPAATEDAAAEVGQDTPAEPAQPQSEAYLRRRGQRAEAVFSVDPGKELSAWTREIREDAVAPEATDEECAAALECWHRHVQVLERPLRFAVWSGETGLMLFSLLAAAHGSMVEPESLRSDLVLDITRSKADAGTLRTWSFCNPEQSPAAGQAVTEIDITGQFLAAARSVDCGDGEPDVLDAPAADQLLPLTNLPGYLRLAADPDLTSLRPAARYSLEALATGWWVPNPVAKYLLKDRQIALAVDRAVVWPAGRKGRRLSTWCTVVADARLALIAARETGEAGADLALTMLKRTYAAFLGGLLRSEDNRRGTRRPDWNDMTISTAGINALRALDKLDADLNPVGGIRDAFWFLSSPAEAPLRPAGLTWADQPTEQPGSLHQPGKWHLSKSAPVTADFIQAHARGRAGLMQRMLNAAAEEATA